MMLRQEFERLLSCTQRVGGFIFTGWMKVLSGAWSAIAIKIFGAELEQLRTLGNKSDEAAHENERSTIIPEVTVV